MKSPQVHHKSVKTKRLRVEWFGEEIGMLFCRPYVVNLNSPLDTLYHLRWKISVVISSTITLLPPPARQMTKNSSHG